MNRNKGVITILCLFSILTSLNAQVAFIKEDIESEYLRGIELFGKEKYASAIKFFDSFVSNAPDENSRQNDDAEFFAALSALDLFNPDAEYRMARYISRHPESTRLNEARLALADYFYQGKTYRKAAPYYEAVNRIEIDKTKLPEYFFRSGYSLFMTGDKETALLMFSEIKDIDTDYTPPALYYFSHIAYEKKMYETALEGFMRLRDDETFGPVVPFYIVQILYLKKDYEGILSIAPDLLKSAGKQRSIELYRFIGDAYYNKGNYTEAVGYLEKYSAGAKASAREDKYQLGYCYYKTGEYDKAIAIFLEQTATSDVLSQHIWCLLGDCYLHKGDKNRALFAFGQASLLNFDKAVKEESLFNYAKLMYETSYSPFGEAINAFQEYIDLYPGSDRIEEVYNYMVSTYTQLKNYKAAIISLDKIRNKNPKLEEAYQRAAFFRGLELVKNMELEQAVEMFDKSMKYDKYNRNLRARAIYWKGEAEYRLGRYDDAIADYQEFMGIPGSMLIPEYNLVRYNLGYAFFNRKDYQTALSHFKTFESSENAPSLEIQADTRNRIADCYYISTNYQLAVNYYDKVIDIGRIDVDYAMYQKGFALGLTNDHRGKTDILTSLTQKYPKSKYIPGALFERGRAFVTLKESGRGETDFNSVISGYPNSPFVPRAIVQLGLLYYDTGENQKAIEQFKKVIENYKSTPESRYALTGLKNTYMEINDAESYFSYVKTLNGYGDVNLAEKDSLLYGSGEKLYMAGNCEKSSEIFRNYLAEFQNGSFRLNALFYLAECAMSKGNKDEAMKYYLDLAGTRGNVFVEPSLQAVSSIYFGKEDYLNAFNYYELLEKVSEKPDIILSALKGELLSAYEAGDAEKTITASSKVLTTSSVPEDMIRSATFLRAKAYYSLNRFDDALTEFRKISGEITTADGAESKYMVAELLNRKGLEAETDKVIDEFIDMNTPHQYWMARIFILLADISIRKGDLVQARATLQALGENYPVDTDGILDEVRSKLESIRPDRQGQNDSTDVSRIAPRAEIRN